MHVKCSGSAGNAREVANVAHLQKLVRKFELRKQLFDSEKCQESITTYNVIEITSLTRCTKHVVRGFSPPKLFLEKI